MAAINGTAVHPHQAEAAALVETQRITVVVGGNDPQAGAPLPPARKGSFAVGLSGSRAGSGAWLAEWSHKHHGSGRN
jgi:hypothetical protein